MGYLFRRCTWYLNPPSNPKTGLETSHVLWYNKYQYRHDLRNIGVVMFKITLGAIMSMYLLAGCELSDRQRQGVGQAFSNYSETLAAQASRPIVVPPPVYTAPTRCTTRPFGLRGATRTTCYWRHHTIGTMSQWLDRLEERCKLQLTCASQLLLWRSNLAW